MRPSSPVSIALGVLLSIPLLTPTTPARGRLSAVAAGTEVRALWVVRDSITSSASIARIVDHAAGHGFNTLLVQVRGRGDAYFSDGIEPRAQLLADQPASFDPLAVMLETAHRAGIEVHAWINVNLVASASSLPATPDHVANCHPEWLMVPHALATELGRANPRDRAYINRLAGWTRTQPRELEGLYLSPIIPAAAAHTVAVVRDLARRYPLDGVHLDYARYPAADFDYSRLALDAFAATMASDLPSPERHRVASRARTNVLAWVEAYPQEWADFRRSRLTALMMRLKTALRAERPRLVTSAAVFPEPTESFTARLQDWRLWAETGLLDVLCPMAYTTDLATFKQQIEEALRVTAPARVWAGIGAYRLTPMQTVTRIETARELGAHGIVLFSYDTIAVRNPDAYLEFIRREAFGTTTAGPHEDR
jgi:uncharacterized lipoprotein YddW (UPF0748 family)